MNKYLKIGTGVVLAAIATSLAIEDWTDKEKTTTTYISNVNVEAFYNTPVVVTNCMQRHCCPERSSFITNKFTIVNSINTVIDFKENYYFFDSSYRPGREVYMSEYSGFLVGPPINCCWIPPGGITSTPPQHIPSPAIPEPQVWALMIIGFGIIGLKLRNPKNKGVLI